MNVQSATSLARNNGFSGVPKTLTVLSRNSSSRRSERAVEVVVDWEVNFNSQFFAEFRWGTHLMPHHYVLSAVA